MLTDYKFGEFHPHTELPVRFDRITVPDLYKEVRIIHQWEHIEHARVYLDLPELYSQLDLGGRVASHRAPSPRPRVEYKHVLILECKRGYMDNFFTDTISCKETEFFSYIHSGIIELLAKECRHMTVYSHDDSAGESYATTFEGMASYRRNHIGNV